MRVFVNLSSAILLSKQTNVFLRFKVENCVWRIGMLSFMAVRSLYDETSASRCTRTEMKAQFSILLNLAWKACPDENCSTYPVRKDATYALDHWLFVIVVQTKWDLHICSVQNYLNPSPATKPAFCVFDRRFQFQRKRGKDANFVFILFAFYLSSRHAGELCSRLTFPNCLIVNLRIVRLRLVRTSFEFRSLF